MLRATDLVMCGVCDEPQAMQWLTGTRHEGFHDLDLRPTHGELWWWPGVIQRCVGCGACARSIEHLQPRARALVGADWYRRMADADQPAPYRDAMAAAALAAGLDQPWFAFECYLAATWAADEQEQRCLADGCPVDRGLGVAARQAAVGHWLAVCGDVFAGGVDRRVETAQWALTGEVLLDNQVLVDLHRRIGRWDRARAMLGVAREALNGTVEQWRPYLAADDEAWELLRAAELMLDLEAVLIRAQDDTPAHAKVALSPWWVE